MNKGKRKCERLSAIRKAVARRYGLEYDPTACTHNGDCSGTCPKCDEELRDLQMQLDRKGIKEVDLNMEISPLAHDVETPPILQGDLIPMPPTSMPKKQKKILYKQCQIAGIVYYDLEDIWDELYEGARLALIRQKDNRYDRHAIAVALADDYNGDPEDFDLDCILGYVPRTENEHLAAMMDMGWGDAFECELSRIEGNSPHGGSLHINIYIVRNEAVPDPSRQYWRLELDNKQYENFISDLFTAGYVYFRWGGFPPWENMLPKQENKVAIINRCQGEAKLHLMYVMATSIERAAYFVEDPEILHVVDDCAPFILTQVSGPLIVRDKDLDFLDLDDTSDLNPAGPLSEAVTDKLLALFGNNSYGSCE